MAILAQSLKKLCTSGCNIVINYSDYLQSSIEDCVLCVVKANGHITIKNCSVALTSSLEKLAAIGKGHITLDFTD